jgi:hypothetical protein
MKLQCLMVDGGPYSRKSVDGFIEDIDDKIIVSPQVAAEASVAMADKITAKKDCGKSNRCITCKLLNL